MYEYIVSLEKSTKSSARKPSTWPILPFILLPPRGFQAPWDSYEMCGCWTLPLGWRGWKTLGDAGPILRPVEVGSLFVYHMIYRVLYGFIIHSGVGLQPSAVWVQYTNSMCVFFLKSPMLKGAWASFWVTWRSNREDRILLSKVGSDLEPNQIPKWTSRSTTWWWNSTSFGAGPKNFRNDRCEEFFFALLSWHDSRRQLCVQFLRRLPRS